MSLRAAFAVGALGFASAALRSTPSSAPPTSTLSSTPLSAGLYGIQGDGFIAISRVYPNGTVDLVSNTSTPVAIIDNLVTFPTPAGTLFALVASPANSENLTLVEIDMATAQIVKSFATPYPMSGILGTGNEMAYIPDENKVVMVGDASASPTSPHLIGVVDVATGEWKTLATFPSDPYYNFMGNFAAYSPVSRTFFFQQRNGPRGLAGVFVNVDTGKVTFRDGCVTDNLGYDPKTDSFVTIGVYRNGTTISDVWRAQMSIKADGSEDCRVGRALYNEASDKGMDVVSIGAFDVASRTYYIYAGSFDDLALVAIEWDTGSVQGPIQATNPLPDTLVYLPAQTQA